jgi:hypothetical protein
MLQENLLRYQDCFQRSHHLCVKRNNFQAGVCEYMQDSTFVEIRVIKALPVTRCNERSTKEGEYTVMVDNCQIIKPEAGFENKVDVDTDEGRNENDETERTKEEKLGVVHFSDDREPNGGHRRNFRLKVLEYREWRSIDFVRAREYCSVEDTLMHCIYFLGT